MVAYSLHLLAALGLIIIYMAHLTARGAALYLLIAFSLLLRCYLIIESGKFRNYRECLLGFTFVSAEVGSLFTLLTYPPQLGSTWMETIVIICLSFILGVALAAILYACGLGLQIWVVICKCMCKRKRAYTKKEILSLYKGFSKVDAPRRRSKITNFLQENEALLINHPLIAEEHEYIRQYLEAPVSIGQSSKCVVCQGRITPNEPSAMVAGADNTFIGCRQRQCANDYHTRCLFGQWQADATPGFGFAGCFHSVRTAILLGMTE